MGLLCPHCRSRFEDESLERCPHDRKRLVADLSGQLIGERYTLRELLGVGGMDSSVWLAWQSSTQRSVAVKILPPVEGEAAERFARGGRIASNLNHPNITTVHDYGRTEAGGLYLVMELLEGVTLYRALRRTPFSVERTVHIIDQVLRALGHAHRRGVVHRDIKLSNLFLTPREDDPDFLKVLDFGIARFIEEPPEGWGDAGVNHEVTTTRQLCGTPQYMAPEQIGFGKIDGRTDLYAVGVATFRMLTGRFPFQGGAHDQFRAHLHTRPPSFREARPDLEFPRELEAWVMRAMEKDADQRFASAEEMRTALRSLRKRLNIAASELEDSSVRSAPSSSQSASSWAGEARSRTTEHHLVPEKPQRKPLVWIALVAVLAFVIILLLLTRNDRPIEVVVGEGDGDKTAAAATTSADPASPPETTEDPAPPGPTAEGGQPTAGDPAAAQPTPDGAGPAADPAADPTRPAMPELRAVRVTSRPEGATVLRDGGSLGRTPLDLKLPPGDHVLKIVRAGYATQSIKIAVTAEGDDVIQAFAPLRRRGRPAAQPPAEPPPAEPAPAVPPPATPPEPAGGVGAAGPSDPPPADPAAAPTGDGSAPAAKKPAGQVRMQLLDEDEAREFDVRGKTPKPAPKDGAKPKVDLIE